MQGIAKAGWLGALALTAAAASPTGAATHHPRTVYAHDITCAGAADAAAQLAKGQPARVRAKASKQARTLATAAQVDAGSVSVTPLQVKRDIAQKSGSYLAMANARQRTALLNKTITGCMRTRGKR